MIGPGWVLDTRKQKGQDSGKIAEHPASLGHLARKNEAKGITDQPMVETGLGFGVGDRARRRWFVLGSRSIARRNCPYNIGPTKNNGGRWGSTFRRRTRRDTAKIWQDPQDL